jgi:hypothetical protein
MSPESATLTCREISLVKKKVEITPENKRGVFGVIMSNCEAAAPWRFGHMKSDDHLGRRHLKGREGSDC